MDLAFTEEQEMLRQTVRELCAKQSSPDVVRALETDDDTLATAVDVGKGMRKEVVVIKESPGFITSRINAMIGNEAFYMLQEGIASASDIDKALKLGLNHPMGPFELVDLVGLDTRLHILEYLHKTLGEKFPLPELAQADLQRHIYRRAAEGIAPVTIRKEVTGLRAAWNWGRRSGLVAAEWPGKGLVYRKGREKPPFQTWDEIERQIARGVSPAEERDLWD